ncbi:MAG: Vitamin transporter BtuB precursor [Verrucomicrobiota bacterium]
MSWGRWPSHSVHDPIVPAGPRDEPAQGGSSIDPFWQLDLYAQTDLSRWVPGLDRLHQVTAQIRVNNVLDRSFPHYANAPSGAGVQAYADWRGRTCSVSVTVAF